MTPWSQTIHARLTLGYAVAFFVGLIVFAAISFTSLDGALKAVIDARLQNAEASIASILSADPEVNHATRERIELVTGANLSGAVLSANGRAVYSSSISIVPAMRAILLRATDAPRLTTLRVNDFAGRIIAQRIRILGGKHVYVGIWRPLDLVGELERIRLVILITAVVIIGGIAVLVGSLVARQGLKPLRAVAALASEIEAHDLSRRLGVQSTSELGQLATTFDRMLERLEDAFERQRRFTADASHELRAPLSVMHVAADLALRREREPAAYRRVIASILQATQQLEELTDRLLAAARADAGYVCIERVDLSAVLADTLAQLTPLAESKQVTIAASLQARAFVNADPLGIIRAIIALVDNAIKFSPKGGAVMAAVAEDLDHVRLTVTDEGPGFTEEGLRRATDRFWRSDAALASRSGSGLGLAICESIVRASGGTLVPQNAAGRGALMLVEFPAAT
jgi:two-component system OmpR family sensor kinase